MQRFARVVALPGPKFLYFSPLRRIIRVQQLTRAGPIIDYRTWRKFCLASWSGNRFSASKRHLLYDASASTLNIPIRGYPKDTGNLVW